MNIKWTHSAVDELTGVIVRLEEVNQPYYARSLEKRIFAKIRNLARDEEGSYSIKIDMCKIDYRITNKDMRVLRISLLRRIE